MHSIRTNRALVDGNKRLALLSTITFLRMNGKRVGLSQDEAYDLVVSVATGARDVEQIAEVFSDRPAS